MTKMARAFIQAGLMVILALALFHISKAEMETDEEKELEEKSQGNVIEELKWRIAREAGGKSKKRPKQRKTNNQKRKAGKSKNKSRESKNKSGKIRKYKKKSTQRNKKSRKSKKKSNKFKARSGEIGKGKKKSKKNQTQSKKKERKNKRKKSKRKRKGYKITRGNPKQTCDEKALCQKIKDYIKISNQLRKVNRIIKSCDTMEKKANKSATEFDATASALETAIGSRRRLYISKWRRYKRSVDEVTTIKDKLKACSKTAKALCERSSVPACLETDLLARCKTELGDWVKKFGPANGSCLKESENCCACITALPAVSNDCLDFVAKSESAVKSKNNCTSNSKEGSFGDCRKQQQLAAEKGPAVACGGTTGMVTSRPTTAAPTAAPTGCPQYSTSNTTAIAIETFFEDIIEKYGNQKNFTIFENKTNWIREDFENNYIKKDKNYTFDDKTEEFLDNASNIHIKYENNTNQDDLNTDLDMLLDNFLTDGNCNSEQHKIMAHHVVEASKTISKIIRSNTFEEIWKAIENNTEQSTDCLDRSCKNNTVNHNFFKKATMGTASGCINSDCDQGAVDGISHATNGTRWWCFAGTGKVETMSGIKNISELVIGDFVRTSSGGLRTHFTEFLGWMLRQKPIHVEMLQVSTTRGVSSLILTGSHIVFTPNSTKYADELVPGDRLVYWNGSHIVDEIVTEIRKTVVIGAWSPLTRDGTLLVDGYLTSCYASFPHQLSDLAMTTVKAMSHVLLDNEESQHEDGVRPIVKLMKKIGESIGARERNLKIFKKEMEFEELSSNNLASQINNLITKSIKIM